MPHSARVPGVGALPLSSPSLESVWRHGQNLRCSVPPVTTKRTQPFVPPRHTPESPVTSWVALHSPAWSSPSGPRPFVAQTGVGSGRSRAAPMPAPLRDPVLGNRPTASGPPRLQQHTPHTHATPSPARLPPRPRPAVAAPSPSSLSPASACCSVISVYPASPVQAVLATLHHQPIRAS